MWVVVMIFMIFALLALPFFLIAAAIKLRKETRENAKIEQQAKAVQDALAQSFARSKLLLEQMEDCDYLAGQAVARGDEAIQRELDWIHEGLAAGHDFLTPGIETAIKRIEYQYSRIVSLLDDLHTIYDQYDRELDRIHKKNIDAQATDTAAYTSPRLETLLTRYNEVLERMQRLNGELDRLIAKLDASREQVRMEDAPSSEDSAHGNASAEPLWENDPPEEDDLF